MTVMDALGLIYSRKSRGIVTSGNQLTQNHLKMTIKTKMAKYACLQLLQLLPLDFVWDYPGEPVPKR